MTPAQEAFVKRVTASASALAEFFVNQPEDMMTAALSEARENLASELAATFGAEAKNAVTGVGAPSYTSGVHIWNGTAETLKQSPANRNTRPNTMPMLPVFAATALPAKLTVPVKQ